VTKRPTQPDDWSSRAEALLRAAREDHAATAADRVRVRSALARRLAQTSGGPATGQSAQTAGLGKSAGGASLAKLLLWGAGVACVVAGTLALQRARDAPPPKAAGSALESRPAEQMREPGASAPESIKPALELPSRPLSAAPVPTVPRPSRARVAPAKLGTPAPALRTPEPLHAPELRAASAASQTSGAGPSAAAPTMGMRAAPPSTTTPAVAEPEQKRSTEVAAQDQQRDARAELAFMARINAALLAAKPQTVLTLCAEHERRWPRGIFVQERDGLRAIAACSSRADGAAALARTYLTDYPRVPLALRVRDKCAPQLQAADAPAPARARE
jgi:hypothetical protein